MVERWPHDPDADERGADDEEDVAQRTEERKLMRRPRWATSSPVLGPRVPTEPPVGPTVACTAARASGLMAERWGASSPSPGTDRAGPSEPSPANGDVIGPVVPGPSSAAQCISGGSADGDTARIWPV